MPNKDDWMSKVKGGKRTSEYSKTSDSSKDADRRLDNYLGSGTGMSKLLNKQKIAIERQSKGQTTDSNN